MRIFVSSTVRDRPFLEKLSGFLRDQGHQVNSWSNIAASDRSILEMLDEQIQAADLFIIVWGKTSLRSRKAENELSAIKMLVDTDETKYMFPIVLDDVEIPIELSRYQVLRMERKAPVLVRSCHR